MSSPVSVRVSIGSVGYRVRVSFIGVKKRSNKNLKTLKNVKKRDQDQKTFVNVIKKRYLFLV